MSAISRVSVVSASYERCSNSKGVVTTHEIKPAGHLDVCLITWWDKIQIDCQGWTATGLTNLQRMSDEGCIWIEGEWARKDRGLVGGNRV